MPIYLHGAGDVVRGGFGFLCQSYSSTPDSVSGLGAMAEISAQDMLSDLFGAGVCSTARLYSSICVSVITAGVRGANHSKWEVRVASGPR